MAPPQAKNKEKGLKAQKPAPPDTERVMWHTLLLVIHVGSGLIEILERLKV